MASLAIQNSIQCTEDTLRSLKCNVSAEQRNLEVKGRGLLPVYTIANSTVVKEQLLVSVVEPSSPQKQNSDHIVVQCTVVSNTSSLRNSRLWNLIYLLLAKLKHVALLDNRLGDAYSHLHFEYWMMSSGLFTIFWLIYPQWFFWVSDVLVFDKFVSFFLFF